MGEEMSIKIEILGNEDALEYEQLINSVESSLLYASFKYRSFLQQILVNSEAVYLVAKDSGTLIGALPAFIRYNHTYGNVLNSLPFYGSYGGVIVSPRASDKNQIKMALIDGLHELSIKKNVAVSTLIANPLNDDTNIYEKCFGQTLRDERIGQITYLPDVWHSEVDLQQRLMESFHKKTRTAIRKAQKSELVIRHTESMESLRQLAEMHHQNIQAVGGLEKPWLVFEAISKIFTYDLDYRVYLAEKNSQIVAALLVFFYNRTVEYFTPATHEGFRIFQPMSLLIYQAMQDAVRRGCRRWNWGGTWLTQGGVYDFKNRWGAEDKPYYYYIHEYSMASTIRSLPPQKILAEYPYFYVLPFKIFTQEKDES